MAAMPYVCSYSFKDAHPSFEHSSGLVQHLTVLGEKLYVKALSVVEDTQVTVQLNGLAPDIAWYVQQFGNNLRDDTSTGLLGVRACFEWLPDLIAALALCDATESLDYIFVENQVKLLVNACRDLLVVRAQFLCPRGDRASFEAVIEEAYGEPIAKNSPIYSKVMNAYNKTLSHLPEMFPSKSSLRSKRPKRVRDEK